MLLGHYAAALGAKRAARGVSLGTLILAAQLLDLLWPFTLLLGLERVRIVPGVTTTNPLDFVHYPITHSLLTAIGWGLLLGLGYYAIRRSRAGAAVVAVLVVSHWVLDAPMHRPDLPLWPGSDMLVGGGLWNSMPATLAVEFGILAAGVVLYARSTKPRDRTGSIGLWAGLALLAVIYLGSLFGPPPPDERTIAVSALALWLLVPWGYWVDRHRAGMAVAVGELPRPTPAA